MCKTCMPVGLSYEATFRLLPSAIDCNDVMAVFSDVHALVDPVIKLESFFASYRERVANHTKPCTGCNRQPDFRHWAFTGNSDGEALARGGHPSCHESKHLGVFCNEMKDLVVEMDRVHNSSLTGYGAEPVSAPTAPGGAVTPAGGDIVRDGTDIAPEATASVEESVASGAVPLERTAGPHLTSAWKVAL